LGAQGIFNDNYSSIAPIPPEERIDTRLYEMFFVWFSANMNILGYDNYSQCQYSASQINNIASFSTGSAGPAFFGLGLGQSLVILTIVDIMCVIILLVYAS
jgi:purine-cytosine permease-like protein